MTSPPDGPLLSVRDLCFSYQMGQQRAQILHEVNFDIARGDYVAIQGPSGSGKSTLFYILGCLLAPDSGEIRFNGIDLRRISGDEASLLRNRDIGFIFQQFHLLPRATVLENILLPSLYPLELARKGRGRAMPQRAHELALRLGLKDHLHHASNQLSGGQQQRVAIARALLQGADLILADEPTGNLDSRSAAEILAIFDELHQQGHTIVVITHDDTVASRCNRVFHVRDGKLTHVNGSAAARCDGGFAPIFPPPAKRRRAHYPPGWTDSLSLMALFSLRGALRNLLRNRVRSLLTMLGIVIGIAAVLAMISLGQFAKERIMEGFEALGVNKLAVYGYPNYEQKATDKTGKTFDGFSWENDLAPLRRLFPEIILMSPILTNWQNTITAGGRSVSENVRVRGVNHEYFAVTNAHLAVGSSLTPYQLEQRSTVCVLGSEIATQLFQGRPALEQTINVILDEQRALSCKVIGVLQEQKTNQEWFKPNMQVLLPYTLFQVVANSWSSRIYEFMLQARSATDVELSAKKIIAYLELRYGQAGKFGVDTEGTLVAQTKRFLNIFALLLAAIAFLSLLVGGIGINNMMLVSITERIKEIGLRKAVGATSRSIRVQVLMESLVLCAVAGTLGIATGYGATELMIYAATKFIPKLEFVWVFDPGAFAIAAGSILAVGLLSGLVPARRAERLSVIEALRAE